MNLKYLLSVSVLALMASTNVYAADTLAVEKIETTAAAQPAENTLVKSVKKGLDTADTNIRATMDDVKAYFVEKNKKPGEKLNPILMRRNMTAHGMIGQASFNAQGQKISAVKDIIIDRNGQAILVVVEDGGVLGIGEKVAAFNYKQVVTKKPDGTVMMVLSQKMIDNAANFSYDQKDWAKAKVIPNGSYSVNSFLEGDVLNDTNIKVAAIENIYLLDGDITKVIVSFDNTFGVGGSLAALNFSDLTLVKKDKTSNDVDVKLSASQSAQFARFKESIAN